MILRSRKEAKLISMAMSCEPLIISKNWCNVANVKAGDTSASFLFDLRNVLKNPGKQAELFANIAIVVVAVLLGVVLVKNYLLNNSGTPHKQLMPGTKVDLANVDWRNNGQTLLLVVQKGCHYCSESAAFYQELANKTGKPETAKLIALLPQDIDEGVAYLTSLGVSVGDVRKASPRSLGVEGTPTLLLVDSQGKVTDVWVGKLPPEKEAEVLDKAGIPKGLKGAT
jgi:hypothetical protein